MQNRWEKSEADRVVSELGSGIGNDLGFCIYLSRLLGMEPDLVMHGGGNTSVKSAIRNVFGEEQTVLYVKASGFDLDSIAPDGFPALDLLRMQKFERVKDLSQDEMLRQLRISMLNPGGPVPSVETFLHAFIPTKYVVHTHPSAILALTNQPNSTELVKKVLGPGIVTVRYIRAGFGLAKEAGRAFEKNAAANGMVLLQHGLVTWGETAEQAYSATIDLVTKAEAYWAQKLALSAKPISVNVDEAWKRYTEIAPVLRGLLAEKTDDGDQPHRRFILTPWIEKEVLEFLEHPAAFQLAMSSPLTPDHLIRTKSFPLFIQNPEYGNAMKLKEQLRSAIESYARQYDEYFARHMHRLEINASRVDSMPRVVLMPGVGAVCAGVNEKAAIIARDITAQLIRVKALFAMSGAEYHGIEEEHLFEMEYLLMQQAKIAKKELALQRQVGVVTGAAGAIGTGITEGLLANGCHVAITDLPGEMLEKLSERLQAEYPHQVLAVPMDVTDAASVEKGFAEVIRRWGGVDLAVVNAGVAMVSALSDMNLERFRQLEKVNVEGTLLVLRESAKIFEKQSTGGDVILISTKNVFSPGAKFGAYSATKAAAHQLARIASLEFADMDVRVNMVAPDAVFSHGQTRSGLWTEVGPDRMKARGLDEAGLEDYYRKRNLLKTTVTAEHVAHAVLFFATRQTPTTGATLPVDGGLPDATPR